MKLKDEEVERSEQEQGKWKQYKAIQLDGEGGVGTARETSNLKTKKRKEVNLES